MMDGKEQEGAQRFYNKYSSLSNNITLKLHLLLPMVILLSFLLTFTSYNSYHYPMSAFLLPLFTHTFEKKYLFILCTTILTFITKKNLHSGLKENLHHEKLLYSLDEINVAAVVEGDLQECEYGRLDDQESKEEHEENTENSEKESEVAMEDEADGEVFMEEGILGGSSRVEEEHAAMNMDTEELNKKIEEFIRKMREELRVEAEQHLINV
ncbi:unnamed protein product [Lactuca virosa]|uniref:Transmembrane protein n=1 Tax=Lactuca virosa TaxID=75947 RepID=A0AAU9PDA1_9ASTR|nr:unnamed protein product [Lactuca virosa]